MTTHRVQANAASLPGATLACWGILPEPDRPVRDIRLLSARLRQCLAALLLGLLPVFTVFAANPTEPKAIAALRADQNRTAAQLEAEAARLRATAKDPVVRAWATLAEAEFANDQEHAEASLAGLDRAIAQADALNLPYLRFEALVRLSTILVNRGQSEQTRAVLTKMQAMVDAHADKRWQAILLHERGVLERKLGHFDRARDLFVQSRTLFRALGDPSMEARELNSIGNLDGRTGRFSDAVALHTEALAISRKAGDKGETARSLRMLGVLYRNLDDEELASRYLLEALDYVEERNRREAIALHGELIGAFTKLEKLKEADHHGQQAVQLAERSGSHPNKVNAFTRMAELRLQQGNIDDAERWVEKASASYDHVAVRDKTLVDMARLRVLAARDRTSQALQQADKVLANVRKLGDRILERALLDLLSDLQLRAGDAASAFATRKAHQKLDKELAIDVAARRIALLEASLASERAEAERQLLQRDNDIQALRLNRQRVMGVALFTVLATVLVIAGLLYARYRSTLRHRNALRDSRDELQRVANTDALTGLANRHAATRTLDERLGRMPEPLSVMLLDLDHFKRINDSHGHQAGDAVLCEVAHRMRDALPAGALLGRWGGEEFIVLLDATQHGEPATVADRLREAVASAPVAFKDTRIPVTVSIGLASAFAGGDIDALLAEADAALYRAKHAGRNRVVYGGAFASTGQDRM
ncbi:MAG: diguanylate cyclase [Rhodocyclaceae bacterium]|nr:MAG: diguanylate cyclase [Rhodocyclaceae bacterium]